MNTKLILLCFCFVALYCVVRYGWVRSRKFKVGNWKLKKTIVILNNYKDYILYTEKLKDELSNRERIEKKIEKKSEKFTVKGYSYPAKSFVKFRVLRDSKNPVNWRESLICPITNLNNRQRASLQIMDSEFSPDKNENIYITEHVTPFFHFLKARYSNLIGSEYLGDAVPFGERDDRGVRNEDLTKLTFEDGCFDKVLSFECLEHIPDYLAAFKECYRVLKPGGSMIWTVPFNMASEMNIVRARLNENGKVEHILKPEYHGDPINEDGCLCFYHFGWQMFDEVREIGFESAYAMTYWSEDFGYLGGKQVIFFAKKGVAAVCR